MITLAAEPDDGIIQVVSVGEASRAEINAHYEALRKLIAEFRAAGRPVRVLSDQTRAVRLSDELSYHLKSQIERTYGANDRLALVMGSEPDRAYAKGVLGVATYAVFESRMAAEMWLMEPAMKPPR